jgi:hypothetical protein
MDKTKATIVPNASHGIGRKNLSTGAARAHHNMEMQRFLARVGCLLLGLACVITLALFCFQGFHLAGFHLETSLMNWIGAATIGTVAGLLGIVYRAVFRSD